MQQLDGQLLSVRVSIAPSTARGPISGRLVVSLVASDAKLPADVDPNEAPFWEDPQPMFGLDITLTPGEPATVRLDLAQSNLTAPIKPGTYRAAARLIAVRENSNWKRDAGNLYGEAVRVEIGTGPATLDLALSRSTTGQPWPTAAAAAANGAELFEVRSPLLSAFRGREVMLRAGVVKPTGYNPARNYAAIYEVPGFGGDHFAAIGAAGARAGESRTPEQTTLDANSFLIVLDPEGPNGHTLFADSANNGPCGKALVEELIPALEKAYALAPAPAARLLRGHSSGGWSTLWLALTYPDTFGATWSSSPDPVDFRWLETVNIYAQKNMFMIPSYPVPDDQESISRAAELSKVPGAWFPLTVPDGPRELASFRRDSKPVMSIRTEAQGEDVLGASNTSGQQWDSWFAVWGPRDAQGRPAALFDPRTGVINKPIALAMRKYDLGELLRADPARYGPLLRERVRLIVGTEDSFFLNEAVTLFKADLDRLYPVRTDAAKAAGYIKLAPGDHGSVMNDPQALAIPSEMVKHLRTSGLLPK